MLQKSTLQFLTALKKHNTKEWFDANRSKYEAAKEDFAALVTDVIKLHGKKDESIASLLAKNCVFRINRDIRFSKDKSPYKTNFGAHINAGGKKGILAGYYFHCEPGGESFAGGGVWMPQPEELRKIRQEIDYNFDAFKKIITSKQFVKVYSALDKSEEVMLSREPKGYEKDNPAIEFIKMKSILAMQQLSDEELTSEGLVKKIGAAFEALQPLVSFINQALE